MPQLHIIVDSTAHVTAELINTYPNLHIVPLTVQIGQETYKEDDLSVEELFHLATIKGHPKTSQPSPGEFLAVLQPLVTAGHPVIIITLAEALSGTVRSAMLAAKMAGQGEVYVIDSGTTACGMVQLVKTAFARAAQGEKACQIANLLRPLAKATHTYFVPGTLEYLHKGGRIGGAATLFGTLLQIKPVLYLVEGKVALLDKVRSQARAMERMVQELERFDIHQIGVVHINNSFGAQQLAKRLKSLYPHVPVSISEVGTVLASHLGPGLVGMIFQENMKE